MATNNRDMTKNRQLTSTPCRQFNQQGTPEDNMWVACACRFGAPVYDVFEIAVNTRRGVFLHSRHDV
jgi:hypothetical protein